MGYYKGAAMRFLLSYRKGAIRVLVALALGVSLAGPAPAQSPKLEALVKELNRLCDEQPFSTGWHLKVLATGETAQRRGHDVVPSGSTRKIAILMAALKA